MQKEKYTDARSPKGLSIGDALTCNFLMFCFLIHVIEMIEVRRNDVWVCQRQRTLMHVFIKVSASL